MDLPDRKLKIAFIISQMNGVGYFRIKTPADELGRQGYEVRQLQFYFRNAKSVDIKRDVIPLLAWCDVAIFQFAGKPEAVNLQRLAMDHQKPVLVEIDDYVLKVPYYNPGKRFYNDQNADQWEPLVGAALQTCNGLIVTTPGLKDLYANIHPNIYVCPNSLVLPEWDFGPKKPNKKIRIGFSGSNAHAGNLELVKKDLIAILDKYPQAEFHFVGHPMGMTWITDLEKQGRAVIHPWRTLAYYPKYLYKMNFDIALAPILDNMFNRGKSNLRLLEAGVNRAAPVASPLSHYKLTFENEKSVLFATGGDETGEWFTQIERLILDQGLREKIGNNARKNVEDSFDMAKNAHLWYDAATDVYKKFHALPIPVTPPENR